MEFQKPLTCFAPRFVCYCIDLHIYWTWSNISGILDYLKSRRKKSLSDMKCLWLSDNYWSPIFLQGKRLVFVTNNSTKSRKQYGKKFETLGLNVNEVSIYPFSSCLPKLQQWLMKWVVSGGNICLIFCSCCLLEVNWFPER